MRLEDVTERIFEQRCQYIKSTVEVALKKARKSPAEGGQKVVWHEYAVLEQGAYNFVRQVVLSHDRLPNGLNTPANCNSAADVLVLRYLPEYRRFVISISETSSFRSMDHLAFAVMMGRAK